MISPKNLNVKMLTTLNGKNKPECTGKMMKMIATFLLPIGMPYIATNIWELKKDFASPPLPIDVILP